MKFLIDADTPYSLIKVFNERGHNAIHVRDFLKFASDDVIFEYANKNGYIVITKDLGFAELFMKNEGFGLILIRLPYYFTADKINKVLDEFLKEVKFDKLVDHITVVELGRYRSKKLI